MIFQITRSFLIELYYEAVISLEIVSTQSCVIFITDATFIHGVK